MAFQSRKSPSGSRARTAGMRRTIRSEKPSALGSTAPKNTRVPRGLIASLNSTNSLGSAAATTSRPCASLVDVPTGPLLKSQTGLLARMAWLRRTNSVASLSHEPIYAALPITNAS